MGIMGRVSGLILIILGAWELGPQFLGYDPPFFTETIAPWIGIFLIVLGLGMYILHSKKKRFEPY
ncbi:MAG TPA: hypothetical protein VJ142_00975 [Candidatus Nanoarchaeia archaeon]|nr:hypothetical protein [Candidatus Nanoarchaeia archaeon]